MGKWRRLGLLWATKMTMFWCFCVVFDASPFTVFVVVDEREPLAGHTNRSYERVRSYGTLSFALFLLVRLPLDLLHLLFTSFHALT